MIQRMSDEHRIKFLESNGKQDVQIQTNNETPKTLQQISQEQKAKRLENKDNGLMTSKHISSARTGEIREEGGPSKQIKMETSNSVWDSNKLAKQTQDSKERVREEKALIANNRRVAEQQRMDDLIEKLRTTDQSKASSVSRVGFDSGGNYRVPSKNMSIFDTHDFQRLAEQTGGEKVSQDKALKMSQKDDSWRGDKKAVSSKEKLNSFIDNLLSNMD